MKMLQGLRARLLAICAVIGCASVVAVGAALTVTVWSWIYDDARQQALTTFQHDMETIDRRGFTPTGELILSNSHAPNRNETAALPSELWDRPSTEGALVIDGETLQDSQGAVGKMSAESRAFLERTPGSYKVQRLDGDRVVMGHSLPQRALPPGKQSAVIYVVQHLDGTSERLSQMVRVVAIATLGSAAVSVFLGLAAARLVLRPLTHVRSVSERVVAGESGARLPATRVTELKYLTATFNGMLDTQHEAVEVLRAQEERARRFASDVSHELRSPLAALVPAAEVLREEAVPLGGDVARAATIVEREILGLSNTVHDLLEITQLDSGTASVVCDEIKLDELISAALESRGWSNVAISGDTSLTVRSDRRRVTSVVTNLVANAMTHGALPVRVDLRSASDTVIVEVSDHGPGVPDNDAHRIFDRLYKVDSARTRGGGTGLGLAIALENARLLGGDLVYYREKHCTYFCATFPNPAQ